MSLRFLAILISLGGTTVGSGAPRFARLFDDHAVLQQGQPIPIWGEGADPDSTLVVRWGDREVEAAIESDGSWRASIPAQVASARGRDLELLEGGRRVAAARDVVIGEVWLVAGQSNMQFTVRQMLKGRPRAQEWVESARCPGIRFRRVDDPILAERESEAPDLAAESGSWETMNPQSVLGFSAVAASFAREIATELEVPIGILDVSWGGKPIEPFIPREHFRTPLLREILALADSESHEALAALQGGVIIRNPEGHPGAIFNARIAPLVPFGIRGFLWYQGESNAGRGEDPRAYRQKVAALAGGWRSRWGDDQLPIALVQLPSFPPATGWVRMREEQRRAHQEIPRSGLVVTLDLLGDDIHPADKLPVGRRLARWALVDAYGRDDIIPSGPLYRGHEVRGNEVRVSFDFAGDGLLARDPADEGKDVAGNRVPLRWFELAGSDGTWHPAGAHIEGQAVVVVSPGLEDPVAVRYACHPNPRGGNLFNRSGLPASPFCSRLDWLPWEDQP